MSKSLNINAPQIVQTRNTLNAVPSGSTATPDYSVKFVPQDLTEEQQAQARQNIGAISATEVPAQVQADWNENDPSDPSYIQNKPTIGATPLIGKYEPFFVQNINNSNETLEIACIGSNAPIITVETSTDGNTWTTLGTTAPGESLTMTIAPSAKVYLRANANAWDGWSPTDDGNRILGVSKVGGNIMSLFYGSNFTGNETTYKAVSAARNLFKATSGNNTSLLDASELLLPAITLTQECHANMFYGCVNLVYGPKRIDAKVCAERCNESMFENCSSLVIAPELPATTLATSCYPRMFSHCTSLIVAPVLPATTLANLCYDGMFYYCTSLTKAADLPAKNVGDTRAYLTMYSHCTSLVYAPTIAENGDFYANGWQRMFDGCSALTIGPNIKLSGNIGNNALADFFNGCSSLREVQIAFGDGSSTIVVGVQDRAFDNVSTYGVLYTYSWNDWRTNNVIPSTWRIVNLDQTANS